MPGKPNILFIITDQQYAGAMSCTGNPDLHTPAMDSLAATGMRFERAYCTHPLCAPCRASFITGTMPHTNGSMSNNTPIKELYKGKSIANLLGNSGYTCALAGKWHVAGATPEEMGFEVLCGTRDDVIPQKSIDFLKRDHHQPFFLMASFTNPHDICQVARNQPLPQGPVPEPASIADCPNLPANFPIQPYAPDMLQLLRQTSPRIYPTLEFTDDDWRRLRFLYYRLVEKVDAEIGRLLTGLRDQGLDENTVIILTSDHGDGHSAHNWNQKTALYEECIRIPFMVSQKGVTKQGINTRHLISQGLDLFPTLCNYAGIDVPNNLNGLNLRPLAEVKTTRQWRDQLVVETEIDIGTGPGGPGASRAIITDRYKYSVYPMGRYREQLVDLQSDPGEMVNLAVHTRYNSILNNHRQLLRTYCEQTDDPFKKMCL